MAIRSVPVGPDLSTKARSKTGFDAISSDDKSPKWRVIMTLMALLASEKRGRFSYAKACGMLSAMLPPDRKVVFSPQAVLALPHLVTDCEAALLKGNRDGDGHPQVLCSFYPGELVRPVPRGLEVASAIVLSPADARALARALDRAAEDAEEQ